MELKNMHKISKLISEIENRLADELSRDLFYARLKNLIYRNENKLIEDILDISEKYNWQWEIQQLDEMHESDTDNAGIILFGCGAKGKQACRLIKMSRYKDVPLLFCDNKAGNWGSEIWGARLFHLISLNLNTKTGFV